LKFAFLISAGLFLIGCVSVKSDVQSDPAFRVSGNRVHVSAISKDQGNVSETILGRQIIDAASKWLADKGYSLSNKRKADYSIAFAVEQQSNNVYVPPQTVMMPVYGNDNSNSTTTVKNSFGQTIGTFETKEDSRYNFAPTGYQSFQTGGYNAVVTDRWLLMFITAQMHGLAPRQVSRGNAFPEKRDQPFFENYQVVSYTVRRLLSESPLNVEGKPPVNLHNNDAGCLLRLGLEYENMKDKAQIKSFSVGSKAQRAGLKVGDVVSTIDGRDARKVSQFIFTEGKAAEVVAMREGKELTVNVLPIMFCPED
jgi:hypothetical protein